MTRQQIQNALVVFISVAGTATCTHLLYTDVYVSRSTGDGLSKAGVVVSKQKNVKRKLGDNMMWDLVDDNEDLYWNDSIETGPKSQVRITLKDGNKIVLGESSLVVLEREDNTLSLNLKSGQLIVDSDKTNPTKTAQIKVNGATVSKKANESLSIQMDELKGEVKTITQHADGSEKQTVTDNKGHTREVEIPAALESPPSLELFFSDSGAMNIPFKWRSEMSSPQTLEIASDKDFKNMIMARSTLAHQANISLSTGSYFWRVKVPTQKGLFIADAKNFEIVQTKVPEYLSPPNGTAIKYRQELPLVEFAWHGTSSADHYIFELSRDPQFKDTVVKQETPNSFFRTSKTADGTLYWKVTAVYGHETRESLSQAIQVKKIVNFDPPSLVSPDGDFKVTFDFFEKSKGIPFRWKTDIGETYRFVFSRSKNIDDELIGFETTQGETLVSDNYPVGIYYWSVGHRDEKGEWKYASPRLITLDPLVPILLPPAILSESAKGEYDLLKNPKLRWAWSKVKGAKEYKFKLFKIGKGKEELVFEDTLDGFEKEKNDLDDGTYKWLVSAVDTYGRESKPVEHKFNVIHGRTLAAPDFDMSGVQ